jgi:hypothetical protein
MRRFIWIFVLGIAVLLAACDNDEPIGPNLALDHTPPPSPQNLQVEKIRDGEIWLSWEKLQREGVAFYVVYRSEGGGEALAIDSTFVSTFQDRGLRYETEYSYHVTVVTQAGIESESSQTVSGQPFNNLSPLAPRGIRAVAHNISILDQLDILLDWDENAETDLSAYRVYRSTEPNFSIAAENLLVAVDEPRYADGDIEVGLLYYYRVTAVDRGDKESPPSGITADVALPQPELMEPVEGEVTSPTPMFRWNSVPHALNYRVVVTTSPTSGEISEMVLTDETAAVFKGRLGSSASASALQSGQIYYWKVIASTREDGAENSVSQVAPFKIR